MRALLLFSAVVAAVMRPIYHRALTPEQQSSVQRFSGDLALRLEYANVDHVYRVFRQQRWQRAIQAIPILLQFVQLFATLPLATSIFQNDLQTIGISPTDGATIVRIAELVLVAISIAGCKRWPMP